jgi:hypothetical protein
MEPPNIAGKWKGKSTVLTQQGSIGQRYNNYATDINNITSFQKIYCIEQNGLFVTWLSQADGGRPFACTQLGIWRPVFRDGEVINWELYITDYDDNQTAIVQVIKTTKTGIPSKIYRTSFESGFSHSNNLQKSEVISTVLTRHTGINNHELSLQ